MLERRSTSAPFMAAGVSVDVYRRFGHSRWSLLLLVPFAIATSFAAVPVVESEGVVPGAQRPPATDGAAATDGMSSAAPAARRVNSFPRVQAVDSSVQARTAPVSTPEQVGTAARSDAGRSQGNGELVYQLQLLQEEVQTLRGQVEEQAYRLKRFEQQQKKRYLGLDQRVQELATASAASASVAAPTTAVDTDAAADGTPAVVAPRSDLPAPGASEQRAYMAAFELTQDKKFEQAIAAFDGLLSDHPNGAYAANSLYWLGELYLALPAPDLERSRQAFVQVVSLHPKHDKVPDALYKLGTLYDRLGDREKAVEYLDRVEQEHPDTPAARLGSTYRQQWQQ